ncbi:MAG: hypothetical protein AB7Q42_23425 [Acidimicrobiia bacterium]
MRGRTQLRRAGTLAVLAGVSLVACGSSAADEPEGDGPASVEAIAGSDLARVTITDDAARRIGLHTALVETASGTAETQIPYAAVLYDPDGRSWAFIKSDELTFERAAIEVDHIDGGVAFLSNGPEVGTEVVTTGAPQLYGAETGVGEDE